jgi:hypothetical protein
MRLLASQRESSTSDVVTMKNSNRWMTCSKTGWQQGIAAEPDTTEGLTFTRWESPYNDLSVIHSVHSLSRIVYRNLEPLERS